LTRTDTVVADKEARKHTVKLNDVGPLVATRALDLRGETKVMVRLGRPERFSDSEDYYCPYEIRGIGAEHVRYAGGVDAVQALELALKAIGATLYTSSEWQTKELTWNGGEDLGFPVPDSLSDLLPGASKQK
jgi:hypothetical protein